MSSRTTTGLPHESRNGQRTSDGSSPVSAHKKTVEQYFEGFRRSDHAMVLACLTDDVRWDLPGYRHLTGKAEFDGEIENEEFVGNPTLALDRLIEEGDTVVAIGTGEVMRRDGGLHSFVYSDVVTFRGDVICRVESYLVPITDASTTDR